MIQPHCNTIGKKMHHCLPRARVIGISLSASLLLLVAGLSPLQAAEETAASCSAQDISTAVQTVVDLGGGTVHLPPCQADNSWAQGDFVEIDTDVSIRVKGAGMDLTVIGYQDGATYGPGPAAMYFGGTGLVEISDFTLRGSDTAAVPTGLKIYSMATNNLRMHHLRLQKFTNTALYICDNPSSPMVIDHCEIGDQSTTAGGMYGIRVHGTNQQDDFAIPASFGTDNPNALFIEDNVFDACYHSVSGFGTSNIVFRHNTVTNPTSFVDGHGACFDIGCHRDTDPPSGTYIYEIYDNIVDSGSYPWCFNIRGGTGIVTDNQMSSCNIGFRLEMETCAKGANCSVDNGCPHSNTETSSCYQTPNQWWVWNNDYRGGGTLFGQSDRGSGCIRQDHEYFLRAPTSGDPVETYQKHTYPHPLVSGASPPDAGGTTPDTRLPAPDGATARPDATTTMTDSAAQAPDSATAPDSRSDILAPDAAGVVDASSSDRSARDDDALLVACGCQSHLKARPGLWILFLSALVAIRWRSKRAHSSI